MSPFIAISFLAIVALSSAVPPPPPSPVESGTNVLTRFYSDFTQIYRPAVPQPPAMNTMQDKSIEIYQFFFTVKEFAQIAVNSLTMLHTKVMDRTITYVPEPNFQVPGTRYFYRRDPKDNDAIEIELVNGENRLFREVLRPERYFHLSSFDGIEYVQRPPMMPHYQVTFVCNSTVSAPEKPRLSYLDKNFRWTPRYILDVSLLENARRPEFVAMADIRNDGQQSIVIQGAEFIAGGLRLNEQSLGVCSRRSVLLATSRMTFLSTVVTDSHRAEGKSSGRRTFPVTLQSPITLAPRTIKSVPFMQPSVQIRPFPYFTSEFTTSNSTGKALNAFNITSMNAFIPAGRLLLREGGQFIGEVDIHDLIFNETATMLFGYDADVSYRRQVRVIENEILNGTNAYLVEYMFENVKQSRDVQLYFTESFETLRFFEVDNINMGDGEQMEMNLDGDFLRGFIPLSRQGGRRMFSYTLRTFRTQPSRKVIQS